MQFSKKAQLSFLQGAIITFGLAVVITAVVAQMLGNIRSTQTTNSYEYNATTAGLTGINTVSSNFSTIAIIVVLAVIVGLFAMFGRKK